MLGLIFLSSLPSTLMAALVVFVMLVLAMVGGSDAAWCVCRPDAGNNALQKSLDYACGAGADCNPIMQNGACYNPNTVVAHCSYAANSYYQRKGQAQGACDFSGTATLTNSDPSNNGCTYPATPSSAGTSSTPATNTPGTTPSTFTPINGGLGPSPNGFANDNSGGMPLEAKRGFLILALICSGMALWG